MLSLISQVWRIWSGAKSVALLATIALSIGIGSTTAIYTVIDAVLLKPLPYENGERFVQLFGARFNEPGENGLSYPDLVKFQQRARSFDVFGWYSLLSPFNLSSPGEPQFINGVEVTPSLADHLGVKPVLGRWFRDVASESEGAYVAVISSALWKRLGSDRNMIGKPITLNGRQYAVTGIMPPWFRLPIAGVSGEETGDDVWIPIDPRGKENNTNGNYLAYARIRPGVTFAQAEAEVKSIADQIRLEDLANHPSYTAFLVSLHDAVAKDIRPTLLLLFGAAGLLLLITCANVAGLLLVRSIARERETAIRVALGAARQQLAMQYFLEGLLISLAGAAIGVFLSFALVRGVLSLAAEFIPRADEISVNWTVLLFALATGFLACILSSQAPLWQALRTAPNEVLNEGARGSASARSHKLSQSLVIAEVALAFTLLSVSALLISQLSRLMQTRPGFDSGQLLTFQLTASGAQYSNQAKLVAYQKRLLSALNSIPAVRGAALVNQLPLAGCCYVAPIVPEGRPVNQNAVQNASILEVSPSYLQTMKIPLRRGRFLNEHDTNEQLLSIVINQAAANYYWPGRDPVGAYARVGNAQSTRAQIVGVVGNVRNKGLGDPSTPEMYLVNGVAPPNPMSFVVRSPVSSTALFSEIRAAVRRIDPAQPIYDLKPMSEIVQTSVTIQRLSSLMTAFYAGAALLMAMLGVYGVVSYSVRQRTVEIGTRMALGAERGDVLYLVLGSGAKMGGLGVALGAVTAALAAWLVVNRFGVQNLEWTSFAYSIAIVAAVALLASFFPAWRATLLSPMVAIRNQPESMWESARRSIRHAVGEVSNLVSGGIDSEAFSGGELLAGFVDATRNADSFSEALRIALVTLSEQVGSQSAILLEKISEEEYRCVAGAPDGLDLECSLPSRGFLLSKLEFYPWPLPFTQGDFEMWLRWATEQKPEHILEIEALARTGARLAVPLRTKKEILGILLFGSPLEREEYSAEQKRMLRVCAEQFSLMLENGRLTERVLEQEKLRRDLALAAEVQKRLLPETPPVIGIGELAAFSLPVRSVGGDYYDFLDIGAGCIGIAVADVAGKGVAAALITSIVHASLRMISAEGNISLPDLAAKMNRFLYRSTRSNSYATFFYAQLDEQNRQLRYVNAGHNPPYLIRSVGAQLEIVELSTGGMIIGMFPEASYEEAMIDLRSGDVLLAFTDGVTEALNPNEEEFGEERLKDVLRRVARLPVQAMSARISRELKDWIRDAPQHDDLTFVLMKVN